MKEFDGNATIEEEFGILDGTLFSVLNVMDYGNILLSHIKYDETTPVSTFATLNEQQLKAVQSPFHIKQDIPTKTIQ